MTKTLRGLPTILVGMLLIAVLFTAYTAQQSLAGHEPANKTAAAGSDVQVIEPDGRYEIMRDRIRVSTAQDAILSVTSECSILTSLITGDDESLVDHDADPNTPMIARDSAFAFGQVEISIELDGKPVPVAADDTPGADADNDEGAAADTAEMGEVVFCNRAYQRTVEDRNAANTNDEGAVEEDIDVERDYIRTRTANAFNWLAGNIGDDQTNCTAIDVEQYCFDNVALNGNNIIDVVVYAEYDTSTSTGGVEGPCDTDVGQETTCAEAWVGSRTLIVEPTNVAIHEVVTETGGSGT